MEGGLRLCPGPKSSLPPRPSSRFAHGGSLAAMMDEAFSKTAYLAGEGLLTQSLNIRFKNLIPVGSLAVLNIEVEKIEDRKLYISCVTQSRDQQTVYAKSSGKEVLSLRPHALSCRGPLQNKCNGGRTLRIQSQAGAQHFRGGIGHQLWTQEKCEGTQLRFFSTYGSPSLYSKGRILIMGYREQNAQSTPSAATIPALAPDTQLTLLLQLFSFSYSWKRSHPSNSHPACKRAYLRPPWLPGTHHRPGGVPRKQLER
nr:acyl-coenzyme A thioesterase THEM5 isoform X1 [Loxodonta africana]